MEFGEWFGIPGEVLGNDIKITITGHHHILLENFRGILDYSDTCLKIQMKRGRLCISGEGFIVDFYGQEGLSLKGDIINLEFFPDP